MLGRIGQFFADRKGAFAIQFALMVVPLTVCTGLAVDGGRVFLARYELAEALDAAALAVGSTTGKTQDELKTLAQTYVNANFKGARHGNIDITLGDNASGVVVNLKGKVVIDTFFMPLVGRDTVDVKAESTIRRGGNNVEVALSIDITGSMDSIPAGDTVRKIDALHTAAGSLIDTVISTSQPPSGSYYSRMAIVPWSNNVYISDATLAATLRGPVTGTVNISAMTWKNGSQRPVTATWRNGTAIISTSTIKVNLISRNGSGSSRTTRIQFNGSPTNVINGVTTPLANGDFIVLTGTTNGATGTGNNWAGQLDNKKFKLSGRTVSGSNVYFTLQTPTSATAATNFQDALTNSPPTAATFANVQKCFDWNCIVQVSGSSFSPAPVAGSNIYLSGFSGSSASTTNYYGLNSTSLSSPWKVATTPAPATSGGTSTFYLQGSLGLNYVGVAAGAAAANGQAQLCFQSSGDPNSSTEDDVCAIQVTAPVTPSLSNGAPIRLTGVSTSGSNWGANINNASFTASTAVATSTTPSGTTYPSWNVEQVSGNSFVLTGSVALNTTVPTSSLGAAQCLVDGCSVLSYVNRSGSRVWRNITQCVTERKMGDVTGDTAPGASQYLGRFYEGDGNAGCTANYTILGLDDDRADLKAKVNSITTPRGTTAGQIGMGWGSYMISPNWRNVIPAAMSEFQPALATQANTSRVVVFMSDGEFNTATCSGVQSSDYNSGSNEYDDTWAANACNAGSSPFTQAQEICDDLRDNDIRVYTVGFDVPADSDAWTFMQNCATETNMAYLAATSAQLQAAFNEIAQDIARLRVSK